MKPTRKSMDQQRGYSGSGTRNSAGKSNSLQRYGQQPRISPWLPVAIGAFAFLVVAKAIADSDRSSRRHHAASRWLSRMEDRWHDWWPDVRDTAETKASRAGNWLYDMAPSRSALYDMAPSRSKIAEFFSRDNDWLPDVRASKRRLLENFDWQNPPRWLRNIDLSTGRKRRQFFRDLRRYSSRKGNEVASSLGWR
jgi:hypothetical protein